MDILIVDDAPISVALLKKLVGQLPDSRPLGFTNAVEGLAWCEQNHPDLVIVDYLMPEIDGIEFAKRFRAMPEKADTPLLMVTAANDREIKHRALRLGINDFLHKPFDQIELQGELKPRQKLTAEIVSGDGSLQRVSLLCRIDTLDELEYYRNGGILHYVLRKLAA